ncbi:hypothetical protein IQ07DRAFT_666948 [Pyrenochaeta sp. DS3sAY3a]|nr:hypothetical protein IQ07DRAFT_666948 [Pyrenochaeta sp. DS3sAY3a]
MHFSKIAAMTITAFVTTVMADNCFEGYLYCSGNLLSQGDYAQTINSALEARNQPTDQRTIQRALFACLVDGEIAFNQLCEGNCVNEPFGSQKNDHC